MLPVASFLCVITPPPFSCGKALNLYTSTPDASPEIMTPEALLPEASREQAASYLHQHEGIGFFAPILLCCLCSPPSYRLQRELEEQRHKPALSVENLCQDDDDYTTTKRVVVLVDGACQYEQPPGIEKSCQVDVDDGDASDGGAAAAATADKNDAVVTVAIVTHDTGRRREGEQSEAAPAPSSVNGNGSVLPFSSTSNGDYAANPGTVSTTNEPAVQAMARSVASLSVPSTNAEKAADELAAATAAAAASAGSKAMAAWAEAFVAATRIVDAAFLSLRHHLDNKVGQQQRRRLLPGNAKDGSDSVGLAWTPVMVESDTAPNEGAALDAGAEDAGTAAAPVASEEGKPNDHTVVAGRALEALRERVDSALRGVRLALEEERHTKTTMATQTQTQTAPLFLPPPPEDRVPATSAPAKITTNKGSQTEKKEEVEEKEGQGTGAVVLTPDSSKVLRRAARSSEKGSKTRARRRGVEADAENAPTRSVMRLGAPTWDSRSPVRSSHRARSKKREGGDRQKLRDGQAVAAVAAEHAVVKWRREAGALSETLERVNLEKRNLARSLGEEFERAKVRLRYFFCGIFSSYFYWIRQFYPPI